VGAGGRGRRGAYRFLFFFFLRQSGALCWSLLSGGGVLWAGGASMHGGRARALRAARMGAPRNEPTGRRWVGGAPRGDTDDGSVVGGQARVDRMRPVRQRLGREAPSMKKKKAVNCVLYEKDAATTTQRRGNAT